jgi:hypothetical protein
MCTFFYVFFKKKIIEKKDEFYYSNQTLNNFHFVLYKFTKNLNYQILKSFFKSLKLTGL